MKINIFEGGRRLLPIVMVVATWWAFVTDLERSSLPYVERNIAAILPAVIAAVLVYLASRIIGWVVRGFLGIPKGQDYRPS